MGFLSKISFMGAFTDWFKDALNDLLTFFPDLITAYYTYFMMLFYYLFVALASILDVIQGLFRKLAGLDEYSMSGTSQVFSSDNGSADIALAIISSDAIMDVFWAMAILGIVILFMSTIVSIIKEEYKPLSEKTTPTKILGKAIRSVFYFLTVPAIAVVGIFIGSALLESLDEATSSGANANLSARIFESAAYSANRYRSNDGYSGDIEVPEILALGEFTDDDGSSGDSGADKIDEAFVNATTFDIDSSLEYKEKFGTDAYVKYLGDSDGANIAIFRFDLVTSKLVGDEITLSIYNPVAVIVYYNIFEFNWLIAYGATIMLIGILGSTMIGLVKRIYKLAILFAISPGIIALMPLTEDPYKNWKKSFISSALAAYSVIVVMNLYLIIMPIIGTIQFYPITSRTDAATKVLYITYNYLAQLLMIIAGSLFFKDFSGELAKMIGADDAYGEGAGKAQEMAAATAKVAGAALTGGATLAMGTKALASGAGKVGGKAGNKVLGGLTSNQKQDINKKSSMLARDYIMQEKGWAIESTDSSAQKSRKIARYNKFMKTEEGAKKFKSVKKSYSKVLTGDYKEKYKEKNIADRRKAIAESKAVGAASYVGGAFKHTGESAVGVGKNLLKPVSGSLNPAVQSLIGTMYGSKLGTAMSPITKKRNDAFKGKLKATDANIDKVAEVEAKIDGMEITQQVKLNIDAQNKSKIELAALEAAEDSEANNAAIKALENKILLQYRAGQELQKQQSEKINELLSKSGLKSKNGGKILTKEDLTKYSGELQKVKDSIEKALKELEKKLPKK